MRHLVRRAFELDARRLVVAHNHPSGNPSPSRQDVATTERLVQVLQAVEIVLEDHCIVAGNRIASLRALGLF